MTVHGGSRNFWTEVIGLLKGRGKNESWLARRLGVPVQTLSSWKQRGQFRRSCLPHLAELLEWGGLDEQFAVQLGVELIEGRVPEKAEAHPTEEALRRLNREYRVAEKVFHRYAGHTVRVLQTLGENCFYAFSAPTNTPYEFENTPEGHEIALALARALCKGGAFASTFAPNEEGVSYYRDSWHYGQLVYHEHAIAEIAAFRSLVKAWLIKGEVPGQPKLGAAEADRILHERLDQCYVSRSPLWMPGVSSSMIGWTHARELKARMTMSLPGARFGGMLVYPRYLTLEFRFLRFLRAVVLEACKEILARDGARREGEVQVIRPENEEDQRSLERFYQKFSQLLRSVYSIEPAEARARLAGPPPAGSVARRAFLNKFACNGRARWTTSVLTRSSRGSRNRPRGVSRVRRVDGLDVALAGDRRRTRLPFDQ